MEANNHEKFSSFNFIRFIAKNWLILTVVFVVAVVLAYVAGSLIPPHYRSTAIIYAPRTNAVSQIILAEESVNERLDMKAYAMEEETEQMMQLLNSREIKDALIQKYDLVNHYDLDTQKRYWQTKLYNYLEKSLVVKRTKYGAISISFEDKDTQLACTIANDVVCLLDSFKHQVENERAIASYNVLVQHLDEIHREQARIADSLEVVMQHGVYDFSTQSERTTQQYAIAVAQGNTAGMQRLEAEMKKLAEWGPKSAALLEVQENFCRYEALCRQQILNVKADMSNNIPTKFVIEKAIVADKKCYPKKSILMTVSGVGAWLLTLIILLVIENLKDIPSADNRRKSEQMAS